MTDQREDESEFDLVDILNKYVHVVEQGYSHRISARIPDIDDKPPDEVLGALLARQTTLALEVARSPGIWNIQVAPLILRSMADVHINLVWILDDLKVRGREFFMYGLGQEKLFVEHIRALRDKDAGDREDLDKQIVAREEWLEGQYADWATEVNVGSWSGKNTREIARSVGLEDMYKFDYVPPSSCVHSTWNFIGVYNVNQCRNVMHKYHFVPSIEPPRWSVNFLIESAKLLTRSFEYWDDKLATSCDIELPHAFLISSEIFEQD